MATCYNRNTTEYQDLLNRFESPTLVDGIISKWQSSNRSNLIPTLFDAEQFIQERKIFYSLKQKDLAESILHNLGPKGEKKLISQLNGEWYIKNTAEGAIQGDPITLENNRKKVERILDFWQINEDAIIIEKTDKSYRIKIIADRLNVTDNILESKDITHANDIIAHLTRLFPDVNIKVLDEEAARKVYNSLPQFQEINGVQYQKKPDFADVKSFYANGYAILIKGRVTSEIAIEEVIHPFISSLAADKPTLFRQLVKESRNSFPMLYQTIQSSYNDTAGFEQADRDMELVAQALSRHFKKEYEEVPTVSFRSKIKQFMKWLMDIFSDLSKWIIGKDLVIYPGMLSDKVTLTDLAKLLNTGDLQFRVDRAIREDRKIRFKLSKKKQQIFNRYVQPNGKGEAQTSKQSNVIKNLFNGALEETEKTINDFSVSMSGKKNHPLTIYNKSNNTFENVEDQNEIQSAQSKIVGLPEENIDLKNDFRSIIESIILQEPIDYNNLKVIDKKTADKFRLEMNQTLGRMIRGTGTIILPQVVVSDKKDNVATTIDLLFVQTDGSQQVVMLEITDYEVNQDHDNNPYNGGVKGKNLITVGKDSVLYDGQNSKFNRKTQRQLDSLKANTARRILQNQSQNVVSASTIYIHAPMKKGKYTQEFSIGDEVIHASNTMQTEYVFVGDPKNNNLALSRVVEYKVDQTATDKQIRLDKKTGDQEADIDTAEVEAEAGRITQRKMGEEAVRSKLVDHTAALTNRKEGIERIKNDAVLFKSGKQMTTEIDRTISIIELGLEDNNVTPVFVELLRNAIKELEEFKLYIVSPENYMNDPGYIGKVLNFAKMVKTYEGLAQFKNADQIKGTAQTLMGKLSGLIMDIQGTRDGVGNVKPGQEGLINEAIDNFAKQFIANESSREFTEEDLVSVITLGRDIGMIEYQTGTMATSSDVILALMDKIFKRKKQEVLDRVYERNEAIREVTLELEKASGGKINYDFMLVTDEDGIPTGRYVQRIGKLFYEEQKKAAEGLKDEEGEEKVYHIGPVLSEKQIQENKELKAAKEKFGKFMRAERYINGKIEDGNFYKYTDEFKTERAKFEYYDGYNWNKKDNISNSEWLKYRNKYYKPSSFYVPIYKGNEFTGKFKDTKDVQWFVKDIYREKKASAKINGIEQNLLDEKWEKLQNPQTELEKAQKKFYDMYVKYFEKDLLGKLPMRVIQQMNGRIPLIKDSSYKNLKKGPNIIARLWAKIKAAPGAVKDYFFTKKFTTKIVLTDESGAFIDTLPIFYVGSPQTEKALQSLTDKINALDLELQKPKTEGEVNRLKEERERLVGRRYRLKEKPERHELSTDLSDSLTKFSAMAEYYEIMTGVEDTLGALLKVLEKRGYKPSDGSDLKTYSEGQQVDASIKAGTSLEDPLIVRRAKKWMKMVFFDNDKQTENFFDKVSKQLISWTSLTYVGLNPWGNLNNYIIGRMNNAIETAGGRWYDRRAGIRAMNEFNARALPDFFKKMGGKTFVNDMIGISPSDYEKKIYGSKWEALVNHLRMMDQKSDIRELNREYGKKETGFQRVWGWGYMLQDAAEYNVQTKVGMAIMMSTKIYKSSDIDGTQTAISLYDAFNYDTETGELSIAEGYDTVIDFQTGEHKKWDDTARYDLRQYIREVNIHIHGNYAYEDRMVMQTSALGQLAAQFHKWIAPAMKARYRSEYYDENLGWLEGRYRTFWSFMLFVGKDMMNARQKAKEWKKIKGDPGISREDLQKKIDKKQSELIKTKSADKQYEIEKEIKDLKIMREGVDKSERYVKNIYRTTAEIGLVLTTIMIRAILSNLWDDEDEEGKGTVKRFQNALMYQMDRQRSELLQFVSAPDAIKVLKSPISSMRMLEEMGQAMMSVVQTPLIIGHDKIWPGEDIKLDKRIYYQRGPKKGQLKLSKEVMDTLPLLYALNRWWSYDSVSNYWVK